MNQHTLHVFHKYSFASTQYLIETIFESNELKEGMTQCLIEATSIFESYELKGVKVKFFW